MPIAEEYRPHYTYDDYCQWEGQWELIEVYQLLTNKYKPVAINPSVFNFDLHDNCQTEVNLSEIWD